MNKLALSPMVAMAILLAGASGVAAQEAQAPLPAAQAPSLTPPSVISPNLTAPPEGKGQVVFFRPGQFMGAAISFKVREGESELGQLSYGTYFVTAADPGAHVYKVHSEAKDELTLEVEAGETYYVSNSMTMGVALYRPNMTPSNQAAFDAAFPKLKKSKELNKAP